MTATAYERMATAPCPAFQWIGQSFNYCDRCSKPYWEHSHDEVSKGGPFSERTRRIVITSQQARAVEFWWSNG